MTQTLTLAPVAVLYGRENTAIITRESVPFGYRGETTRIAFVVATSTGYRATLPECLRDDCTDGTVQPCALAYGHTKSTKGANGCDGSNGSRSGHCHGWHEPSVRRFAEDVLATYGYKVPKVPKGDPRPGVARPKYPLDAYAR